MFQHLHQCAFAASTLVDSDNPDHRPVPMQQRPHLARCEKQVVTAFVRLEKPETILVTDDPSGDKILFIDQTESIPAITYHLTIAFHRVQSPAQRLQIILFMQIEHFGQLLPSQRRAEAGKLLHDVLATGDGIVVLFPFADSMRVFLPGGFPVGAISHDCLS